jgi:membrane protease YdiL (CAAX protease family)
LSAGVVEEVFFRGFLQPRVGIAASSALFALAHLSYEQPLMLLGILLLSVLFALLTRWRQSVWAAIAAHAVFDAIQLLVLIPWAMKMIGEGA